MTDDRDSAEELAAIASIILERQKDDPLLSFEPHDKQRDFIESVLQGKKAENWLIAANRSGKSEAGAYCGAALARFGRDSGKLGIYDKGRIIVRDRATSGWVSALDFPMSRDVIQPKYFDNGHAPPGATHAPFIPDHEIAPGGWNKTDNILKLKNGSIIGFKSADSGRTKYQGAEKDWIHFDEEHSEDIYEESVIRVGPRPLVIFHTVTLLPPEGVVGGVSWSFPKVIEPFKQGILKNIGVFGASIYDNPHIPRGEIERLEAIYPEGSTARRIRLMGEWLPGIGGARAYPGFIRSLHVGEQPEINPRLPLCWIWDFNVEPLVSLIGQKDKRTFRVFRELILDEGSIPEMCEMFRQVHPIHRAEIYVYGDARGRDRSVKDRQSDYTTILNEMRGYGALRLRVPEANPPVAMRINAVNHTCKDEVGEINLGIDPSCVELISDMEQVLRDPKGGIKKTYNRKDPYFRRTHMSDALGYWISYDEPIRLGQHIPPRTIIRSPGYRFG